MQSDVSAQVKKHEQEAGFLRSLNETLLSNQKDFQQKLGAAKTELAAKEETINDLQEQVSGKSADVWGVCGQDRAGGKGGDDQRPSGAGGQGRWSGMCGECVGEARG
jgi:hypothetical protein